MEGARRRAFFIKDSNSTFSFDECSTAAFNSMGMPTPCCSMYQRGRWKSDLCFATLFVTTTSMLSHRKWIEKNWLTSSGIGCFNRKDASVQSQSMTPPKSHFFIQLFYRQNITMKVSESAATEAATLKGLEYEGHHGNTETLSVSVITENKPPGL